MCLFGTECCLSSDLEMDAYHIRCSQAWCNRVKYDRHVDVVLIRHIILYSQAWVAIQTVQLISPPSSGHHTGSKVRSYCLELTSYQKFDELEIDTFLHTDLRVTLLIAS